MSSAKPVCLVLGGGAGIGYSVARRWAKEGHQVNNVSMFSWFIVMIEVVVTRRGEVGQDVMDKECHPGVVAIASDVTDQVRMEAVVKEVEARFGTIKTLIYNAGLGVFKKYDSLTVAELEKSFAINTSGLLIAAKLCAPKMIEAGGGVIGITGATASLRGKPFTAGFAPAKAAQRMLAQSLARDLGPQVKSCVCYAGSD